jgi:hypothetical protein
MYNSFVLLPFAAGGFSLGAALGVYNSFALPPFAAYRIKHAHCMSVYHACVLLHECVPCLRFAAFCCRHNERNSSAGTNLRQAPANARANFPIG